MTRLLWKLKERVLWVSHHIHCQLTITSIGIFNHIYIKKYQQTSLVLEGNLQSHLYLGFKSKLVIKYYYCLLFALIRSQYNNYK